jgi:hypothetical protein
MILDSTVVPRQRMVYDNNEKLRIGKQFQVRKVSKRASLSFITTRREPTLYHSRQSGVETAEQYQLKVQEWA